MIQRLHARAKRAARATARWTVSLLPNGVMPDPFASVWDEASLDRQRYLLRRVADIAAACEIRLFIGWGTLIGHVREGAILAWDDDVDLIVFASSADLARLCAALEVKGLATDDRVSTDQTLKVFDPAFARRTRHPWTWPFVDIFPYPSAPPTSHEPSDIFPISRKLVLPGRPALFEGASLWEPEDPLALLDAQYPGWRTTEMSPHYDHRHEREVWRVRSRRIVTCDDGRKMSPPMTPTDFRQ